MLRANVPFFIMFLEILHFKGLQRLALVWSKGLRYPLSLKSLFYLFFEWQLKTGFIVSNFFFTFLWTST